MLEEDFNLVGYSTVVGCVVTSVSKDHNAFVFRDIADEGTMIF
jgi:hypothetical protein